MFTTQHPEPWPHGVEELARGLGVGLLERRWQVVGDSLSGTGRPLADDFVDMLAEEALVHPAALTPADWQAWREGNRITRSLGALLGEADHQLQLIHPGHLKRGSVVYSSTGQIYRSYEFAGLQLWVGFWPSRKPADPVKLALDGSKSTPVRAAWSVRLDAEPGHP